MATRPLYVQSTLLPPEAVELTLRIGLVGSADHAQMQYEVRNASDGELLAMASHPHLRIDQVWALWAAVVQEALDAAMELVVPF